MRPPAIFLICLCLLSQAPRDAWAETATETLARDIAPGESLQRAHPLIIKGQVGAGAQIRVTNGGIRIEGDVGDGTSITAQGTNAQTWIVANGQNNQITINTNGNSRVVVNGQVMRNGSPTQDGPQGIEIDGHIGSDIRLETTGSISAEDAAEELRAKADGSIGLKAIGQGSELRAGGSITAGDIGGGKLDAGGSISCGNVAKGSSLKAGGSITAGYIEAASLLADGSIVAQGADEAASLRAGGSVIVSGN